MFDPSLYLLTAYNFNMNSSCPPCADHKNGEHTVMASQECAHLSLQQSWAFLFSVEDGMEENSAHGLAAFLAAAWCSLSKLGQSFAALALNLVIFLYYAAVGMVKLGTGLAPHVLVMWRHVYTFHREQLTYLDLLFELLLLSLLAGFYLRHKEISAYMKKLERNLVKKSRLAKNETSRLLGVAPHFTFFFVAMVSAVMGRRFLAPVSSKRMLPLFSLVLPVVSTTWTCLTPRRPSGTSSSSSDSNTEGVNGDGRGVAILGAIDHTQQSLSLLSSAELRDVAREGRSKALLWIGLTVYHAAATTLSLLPFSDYLLSAYVPFLREMALIVAVFTQLSPFFGEIVFEVASPVLVRCAESIPSSRTEEERGLQIVHYLQSFDLISDTTARIGRSLFVEGTTLVILLLFCCMPTRIATVGVVVVGLLLPGIRASTVINAWDASEEGARGFGLGSVHRSTSLNSMHRKNSTSEGEGSSVSAGMLAALRNLSPLRGSASVASFLGGGSSGNSNGENAGSICKNDGSRSVVRFNDVTTEVEPSSLSPSGEAAGAAGAGAGAAAGDSTATPPGATPTDDADTDADASVSGSGADTDGARSETEGDWTDSSTYEVAFNVGAFSSGRKVRRSHIETCNLILRQQRWLQYYVCVGTLWAARCYGFVFWPSVSMAACWWLSHSIWNGARRMSSHLVNFVQVVPAVLTPLFTLRMIRGIYRYLYSWAFGLALGGEPSADSLGYLESTPLASPNPHYTPQSPFLGGSGKDTGDSDDSLAATTPASVAATPRVQTATTTPAVGSATTAVRRRHGRSRGRSGSTTSNASVSSSNGSEDPASASATPDENGRFSRSTRGSRTRT